MMRSKAVVVLASLLLACCVSLAQERRADYPSFSDEIVSAHEVIPHRDSVPVKVGGTSSFNQVQVELVVSPAGDVVSAKPEGNSDLNRYWPQIEPTVLSWKFRPFERNGMPVTARVTEYVNLVPPERMPAHHVPAPVLRPGSKVEISLSRSGCLGPCPSYKVRVTPQGVTFDGYNFVVAEGKYTATADASKVRELAKEFIADDFYSMSADYWLNATDGPSYVLSISIDGDKKKVVDYFGPEAGMPEVIRDLEQEVDALAGTRRWIDGADGLVAALRAEDFNFGTRKAQVILKRAARRGQTDTVRELLVAGVPLYRLSSLPAKQGSHPLVWVDDLGWLASASDHFQTLQVLMAWGASRYDQSDKDVALAYAAQDGDLDAVKALIGYGANPNADLSTQMIPEEGAGGASSGPGKGSILIYAAQSGNPHVVREILRYHPNLEARGPNGQTAMFAAADDHTTDHYQNRVECVRLLAEAGANVNARDKNGDTPLHETFLTDVERELLKLGANVNARDKDGDTPLFTTVDDDAIPLFIRYGADLSIRNNKGQTVLEATKSNGPIWEAELRKAMAEAKHSNGGKQ